MLLASVLLWPSIAAAQNCGTDRPGQPAFVAVTVDNDLFFDGTDRHYTNGVRFDWAPHCQHTVLGLVPLMERTLGAADPNKSMYFSVGQNMFTPDDISVSDIVGDDRPYAGWLYFSTGVINRATNYTERLEVTLGIVGPASLAGDLHRTWHDWFNFTKPNGWANQLKNEPGLVIFYERQWRRALPTPGGFAGQLLPHVNGALGNIYTYAAAGLTLRFGQNLPQDTGPTRTLPGLPGGPSFEMQESTGFAWYIFGGAEGRAVARNIFLDGNSFRNSHSVDKKRFVGELNAGVALLIRDVFGVLPPMRISYTHVWRGREFDGQKGIDRHGSISISVRL